MTAEQAMRDFERGADEFNRGKRNVDNIFAAITPALAHTPKPDPRADLVDLFEARAETHDDKSWIEVEEAVDLVMDREAEVIRAASARVLRRAAAAIPEKMRMDELALHQLDYAMQLPEASRVMLNGATRFAERLRARAASIEQTEADGEVAS